MTTPNRIWIQTTNQPTSLSPWRAPLTAETLAGLLGWNPAGEAVQVMLGHLTAGKGVEAFTRAVPHAKGTDGIAYTMVPYVDGQVPEGQIPRVAQYVRLSGS